MRLFLFALGALLVIDACHWECAERDASGQCKRWIVVCPPGSPNWIDLKWRKS